MVLNESKPKKLYQVWKGNNKFLCGGRLIFGPDTSLLFLSTFLIIAPAILFSVKLHLNMNDSQTKNPDHSFFVLVVTWILTILDIFFLFVTSSTDPGIVPRNTTKPLESSLNSSTEIVIDNNNNNNRRQIFKDVIIDGHKVKVKFCETCLIYRPPRTSHCSICDNCVQRFDHHCPWIGQCIGLRNYRFFFMLISTSTLLCIHILVFSLHNIHQTHIDKNIGILKAISIDILSNILIVYCFITIWFVGGLTIFHSYLICTNQTTYISIRYENENMKNPYNRGFVGNLWDIFLSEIPSSLNNFTSFVKQNHNNYAINLSLNEDVSTDIEMGNKIPVKREDSLPEILRNLNFEDDDDDDDDDDDRAKINDDDDDDQGILFKYDSFILEDWSKSEQQMMDVQRNMYTSSYTI